MMKIINYFFMFKPYFLIFSRIIKVRMATLVVRYFTTRAAQNLNRRY